MGSDLDRRLMARALELAARGEGSVEPNPMVGCVVARNGKVVGEGWHRCFGGPHAEIDALRAAGEAAAGATMYVTLEPCCHHGKTPPCSQAVLDAGIERVVVAAADPFPQVSGGGIRQLREAGLTVDVGSLKDEANELNRPYLKLVRQGRPWVIAKWAMTLDGRIASRTGSSKWISCEDSRAVVHQLRGRVDAVIVGRGTVAADDPLLTARPPGPRTPVRTVLDSSASLSLDSQLVRTATETPVLLVTGPDADSDACGRLQQAGCEIWRSPAGSPAERWVGLLDELGRRRMTNVLVEGGGGALGALFDACLVDEVHVFIAPKLVGGVDAPGPVGGAGIEGMLQAHAIDRPRIETSGNDVYVRGRITRPEIESALRTD